MAREKIRLVRNGNALVVLSYDKKVISTLTDVLHYFYKYTLTGRAAREAEAYGEPLTRSERRDKYTYDFRRRLVTGYGCFPTVREALEKAGYEVELYDETPPPVRPDAYEMDDKALHEALATLEGNQRDILIDLLCRDRALVKAPTGYGKTFLLRMFCSIFKRAKIHIVSRRAALIHKDIFDSLAGQFIDVGKIGGGKQSTSARVSCITADSLHHVDFDDCDILFVDEPQDLCADSYTEKLAQYNNCRMMAFSASPTRSDNHHERLEMLFGKPLYEIPFQDAVSMGRIVPLKIHWRNVMLDMDPSFGVAASNFTLKTRLNYWQNEERNLLIAKDARSYGPDVQTLIVCDKVEHVMALRRHLPEFTPVFCAENTEAGRIKDFTDMGALRKKERLPHKRERLQLQEAFSKNKLKKAIATDVWNVGVNFPHLEVVILAMPGSDEAVLQRIGRAVRKAKGKTHAIIHDYYDTFNTGTKRKSQNRFKLYQREGHTQFRVDARGALTAIDRL